MIDIILAIIGVSALGTFCMTSLLRNSSEYKIYFSGDLGLSINDTKDGEVSSLEDEVGGGFPRVRHF